MIRVIDRCAMRALLEVRSFHVYILNRHLVTERLEHEKELEHRIEGISGAMILPEGGRDSPG